MGHASSSEFEQDPDIRSVRRNRVTLGRQSFRVERNHVAPVALRGLSPRLVEILDDDAHVG